MVDMTALHLHHCLALLEFAHTDRALLLLIRTRFEYLCGELAQLSLLQSFVHLS